MALLLRRRPSLWMNIRVKRTESDKLQENLVEKEEFLRCCCILLVPCLPLAWLSMQTPRLLDRAAREQLNYAVPSEGR